MASQPNIRTNYASQAGDISVLLVAPKSNLKTNEELNRIARSGVSLQVLDGDDVTSETLTIYLTSVRPNVVHFGQHGDVDALQMCDGPMTARELISILQCIELSFIVVNACTSLAIASDLHAALSVPVIAHPIGISDEAAISFAATLYRTYVSKHDLREAVDVANANIQLRFPGTPAARLLNGTVEDIRNVSRVVEELRQEIKGLSVAMGNFDERIGALEKRAQSSRMSAPQVAMYVAVGGILLGQFILIMR